MKEVTAVVIKSSEALVGTGGVEQLAWQLIGLAVLVSALALYYSPLMHSALMSRIMRKPSRTAEAATDAADDHARLACDEGIDAQSACRYPCPCCGFLQFSSPPGGGQVCGICLWKDDDIQLRWPKYSGGANRSSLITAQRTFLQASVHEAVASFDGRLQDGNADREPGWRPIADGDEVPDLGVSVPYPDDPSALYWWRPNYWRLDLADSREPNPPTSDE